MSRPIDEPYPEQDIARNKFAIKDTRQHVEATRWYTLDNLVPPDDGPILNAGFFQIGTPFEDFAFRLARDGSLQTKGMLDVSGATSGDVAWVMPGPGDLNTEPYTIPFADGNDVTPLNQTFGLRVTTTGDELGATPATGYIDSSTGDVTLTWASAGEIPYIVCKNTSASQTMTPGNQDVLWAYNVNAFPSVFTPDDTEFNPNYNHIRFLEDGLYTASCTIDLFNSTTDFDWSLAIWTVDNKAGSVFHRHKRGFYNHSQGFGDASFDWTFRIDGTGGSNRWIEFQFFNFHATANLTAFNTYIEVYKHPGTITMTGRNRSANPG